MPEFDGGQFLQLSTTKTTAALGSCLGPRDIKYLSYTDWILTENNGMVPRMSIFGSRKSRGEADQLRPLILALRSGTADSELVFNHPKLDAIDHRFFVYHLSNVIRTKGFLLTSQMISSLPIIPGVICRFQV